MGEFLLTLSNTLTSFPMLSSFLPLAHFSPFLAYLSYLLIDNQNEARKMWKKTILNIFNFPYFSIYTVNPTESRFKLNPPM
jgi:hypothetical protein